MLITYTSKSGKRYTYHEMFNDFTKDLVIVSSDDITLRVDSGVLKASSSVFESMVSTCGSDDIPKLDHTSSTLSIYLSFLFAETQPTFKLTKSDWEAFTKAVKLCETYDTPEVIRKMLGSLALFGLEHHFHLFEIAAMVNDVFTATKLILVIGKYDPDEAKWNSNFWDLDEWDVDLIEDLPGHWVWAYMKAHHATDSGIRREDYWAAIAAKFITSAIPFWWC
ncbi:hypothetical protein I302_101775 [Kwoniella bestiolae CBS 10118]|uniref:BTB domain-containing protein n=1 Tax=Kwoniella bestiolae CBS 10118 TaxID=1296100 RepID=A0A1B9GD71_9TREE|nr:hypothetical protein I302_00455 [Kwoniella bestiolae CBS 10118]OCF28964.1 hypothetical protein I302_00455 [Kwoniella bestiolae CBS 10118]